ncbi:head maturation protease, ClpP-related [Lactobacillus sp. PV037]|uniref:head maturation protease, ClpP-related n=1 Tax=Lactobacillus sp. PV037 TaxID=2594496 RepID=UPI00224000D3|nr:head maturation protease, ClpP-related [Lactobacillus sp. PV037]
MMTKRADNMPKYLEIKQSAGKQSADIFIQGPIVEEEWEENDVSATGFRDALQKVGNVKEINLHINSPGGSVFAGIAINNMLQQHPAKVNVYVDALAASIASVIAMAGDTIFMPENSFLMIHNPAMMLYGNASDLRKAADDLDQMTKASVATYLNKSNGKIDEDKLHELMDAETWLTAQEAVDYGLADEILKANTAVASLDKETIKEFKHMPKQLIIEQNAKKPTSTSTIDVNVVEELKKENNAFHMQLEDLERSLYERNND